MRGLAAWLVDACRRAQVQDRTLRGDLVRVQVVEPVPVLDQVPEVHVLTGGTASVSELVPSSYSANVSTPVDQLLRDPTRETSPAEASRPVEKRILVSSKSGSTLIGVAIVSSRKCHPAGRGRRCRADGKISSVLTALGIDLTDVFLTLQSEGVEKFAAPWAELLETGQGQLDAASSNAAANTGH